MRPYNYNNAHNKRIVYSCTTLLHEDKLIFLLLIIRIYNS